MSINSKPKFKALIFSSVTLLILILFWWYADHWYKGHLIDEKRAEVSNAMRANGNALGNAINSRMALISGLKAFILTEYDLDNTLSQNVFDKFAAGLYISTKGIRAIQVLPGGVVRYVYPLAGNEEALGHDLLHDSRPDVREDVQRTIRTGKIALSNPYELLQGGLGVVERLAIYKSDDTLWGLAVIVLDIPPLLEGAGITQPVTKIVLSLRDKSRKLLYGREEVFLSKPVIYRVDLPDGYWELAGIPKEGWDLSIQGPLSSFRAVSLLMILMLTGLTHLITSRQTNLVKTVQQRTSERDFEFSENKLTKESLAASELQFRELLENIQLIALLLDVNGRVIFCNDSLLGLTGFTREELLGCDWFEQMVPDAHPEGKELFLSGLRNGEIQALAENPIRVANGSLRHILWNNTILRDAKGRVSGTASIGEDITERKKTVDALARSEQMLRLLVEHAPASIAMFDKDMKYLAASQRFLMDYNLGGQEIIGRSHYEIFPDLPERWKEIHRRCLAGAIEKAAEDSFPRLDGKTDWVRWEIHPWHEVQGEIGGIILFSEVITDRKLAELELVKYRDQLEDLVKERTANFEEKALQLERSQVAMQYLMEDVNDTNTQLEQANERLKEVDRLKSMFIASMSHELRTPLNSVIGFSSILINEWVGPLNDEQKKNLSSILRSGKHLLSLINDVIDVSKIEAGMIETSREDFELSELLAEVEQTFAKEAQDRKLLLSMQPLSLAMHTDRRRLLQCILNLVSNALKFTEAGGVTVAVCHDERKKTLTIAVTDSGIGIGTEDQAKLFQAFSRIQSHLSATVLGTGLGLYLTRKIVIDILQGEISVTSELCCGSTFTMTIPTRIVG